MPSCGPEPHPISTVQTQSLSTLVPAPEGLQSPLLDRGVLQRDGGVGVGVWREQWHSAGHCDSQGWVSAKNHQLLNA